MARNGVMKVLRFALAGESQLLENWIVTRCSRWFGGQNWKVSTQRTLPPAASLPHWTRLATSDRQQVVFLAIPEEINVTEALGAAITALAAVPTPSSSRSRAPQVRAVLLLGAAGGGLSQPIAMLSGHGIEIIVLEVRLSHGPNGEMLILNAGTSAGAAATLPAEFDEELEVLGDPLRALSAVSGLQMGDTLTQTRPMNGS